jgi:hypothetical protein
MIGIAIFPVCTIDKPIAAKRNASGSQLTLRQADFTRSESVFAIELQRSAHIAALKAFLYNTVSACLRGTLRKMAFFIANITLCRPIGTHLVNGVSVITVFRVEEVAIATFGLCRPS